MPVPPFCLACPLSAGGPSPPSLPGLLCHLGPQPVGQLSCFARSSRDLPVVWAAPESQAKGGSQQPCQTHPVSIAGLQGGNGFLTGLGGGEGGLQAPKQAVGMTPFLLAPSWLPPPSPPLPPLIPRLSTSSLYQQHPRVHPS